MKKSKKLLLLSLFTMMLSATMAGTMMLSSAESAEGNLTPWGDAETESELFEMTDVAYGGNHSYKVTPNKQIRIASPTIDGTMYKGSVRVKAVSGTSTFHIIGVMTSQMTNGSWDYAYFDLWDTITVTDSDWTEYTFTMGIDYNASEHVMYYSEVGKGERSVADVAVPTAGFDLVFRLDSECYMDDFSIVPMEETHEDDYTKSVFHYDFEESNHGFGPAYEGAGPSVRVSSEDEDGCTHTGNGAMKITSQWTRLGFWNVSETEAAAPWIQDGRFYELSAYVKDAGSTCAEDSLAVLGEMYIWGAKDGWFMCNTRIVGIRTSVAKGCDWTRVSGVFGVYAGEEAGYVLHNNGANELLEGFGDGAVIPGQVIVDFGSYAGQSLYWDDIALTPTTVERNVTFKTIGVEEGATLVVYSNGEALRKQPEIVKNGDEYTIKGLSFESYLQKYTVKVMKGENVVGEKEVSYINNDVTFSAQKYTATVTVVDNENKPITNATLTYGETTLTENANGVFTIADLDSSLKIVVSAENKIKKTVDINFENYEITVVLSEAKPAIAIDGNLIAGDMETGFAYPHYHSEGADLVITDEEQYEGSYSAKMTTSSANAFKDTRIDGIKADGTLYYVSAMVKSTDSAGFFISAKYPSASDIVPGGWDNPNIDGEVKTVGNEWTLYTMIFGLRYDEETKKVYLNNGNGEYEYENPVNSVAAFDLYFCMNEAGKTVYIDSLAVLEMYDVNAKVLDDNGVELTNATFEVIDYMGNRKAVTPTFNESTKSYKFTQMKGVEKIIATVGEKTYEPVTVSKSLTNVSIENSYTINLTLKDQNDKVVKGAKVIARKGVTTVGEFVDNGDGTYTLTGVMGSVSVVVTIDGYTFEKTNVTMANATLTVTGVNENASSKGKKGCKGSIELLAGIPLLGAALTVFKKKEN